MENQNKPKTFLRILESDDKKYPKGTMVELKMGKDGKAKVVGDPVPFPADKVVKN